MVGLLTFSVRADCANYGEFGGAAASESLIGEDSEDGGEGT